MNFNHSGEKYGESFDIPLCFDQTSLRYWMCISFNMYLKKISFNFLAFPREHHECVDEKPPDTDLEIARVLEEEKGWGKLCDFEPCLKTNFGTSVNALPNFSTKMGGGGCGGNAHSTNGIA
ncbi:hypothetical protein AVEN_127999-1 [Araneus ventricosus]|uniref:Uncharacterized protein n=1 Tax=Araneus ventricosus TaxID=182803 RepID=A0A4Y2A159_ARAVE|nr:hypothetical protein AVEN_127999-1 [Araneus ventricosus]